MPAPSTTSLAQCWLWYIRARATSEALPYSKGPAIQVARGQSRWISTVAEDAAEKAIVACPEGKDWYATLVKPLPGLTDYLPAKTMVCDAYGNIGILAKYPNSPAVVSELLNTPDVTRIKKMMSRYPSAVRPQVGS